MKHQITDDVDININVELPTGDLEDLIDKVTESTVIIIVAITVGSILKSIFQK